jgi:hypothetical protein
LLFESRRSAAGKVRFIRQARRVGMRLVGSRGGKALGAAAFLLIGIGTALSGCARHKDNPVLAEVGDTKIRKQDFVAAVEKAPRDTWAPLDSLDHAGRLEFLKTMIAKEVLTREAARRHPTLPADREYLIKKAGEDKALALLADAMTPRETSLSADELEQCRHRMARRYAAHTLVLDNEAKAKDIASRSWSRDDFNDLVRRETLELTLKESFTKDFMEDVTIGQFVPDAMEAAENAGAGDVIGPFRGQEGWFVYRIDSTVTPPDSALRDTTGLAEGCRKLRAAIALWDATKKLMQDAKVSYNDGNIVWFQQLYSKQFIAAHDSLHSTILSKKEAITPRVDEADRGRELVSIAGKPFTAGDLVAEMAPRPVTDFPNVEHRGSIRLLVEQIALNRVLLAEAERRGITRRAEVAQAIDRKRREQTFSYLLDVELYNQAAQSLDEEKLHKYYEDHIDAYKNSGKIRMAILYLPDYGEASALALRMRRGEPFDKVVRDACRKDPKATYVPSTGLFDGTTDSELYGCGREMEIDKITGPVRLNDGRTIVYKVLERTAPEPLPYDYVHQLVQTNATFGAREQILQTLIPQLEKKDNVRIYEDRI